MDDAIYVYVQLLNLGDDVVESDVDNAQHVFEIEDGSDDDDDFEEDTGFAAKREIGLSILLCLIAKSKINFLTFIWNPSMVHNFSLLLYLMDATLRVLMERVHVASTNHASVDLIFRVLVLLKCRYPKISLIFFWILLRGLRVQMIVKVYEFEVALIIADYCMPPMTGFGLFRKIKVDLEEAKGQEITKLQNALQEMQGKLDEAHNQIIHEKEAEKFAIEQAPPVIKEVPIVDYTKVEELENHNHEPESSRRELEFEQKYNEVENESKYRFKELEESQAKIPGLQETIERLDANLSNLELENQVLRQEALVASTIEELNEEAEHLKTKIKELESENELLRNQQVVCGANNHPCKVITAASAYVDWFAWDNAKHPSTLRWPEQKKRFIPSKWEAKR
ncbi:hypothetical protein SSX86_018233 [Deinandra increscens subsp. villosa]|uniref:Uncharacterized protein n=1 Tax=Deinandra increscens subsp. villosa TaxID=3103831 RepID=A0AAP0CUX8_9ASTR